MKPAKSARQLGRRSTVAVLAVIAVAVATLGLLVAQTSRHSIDGARLNLAGGAGTNRYTRPLGE